MPNKDQKITIALTRKQAAPRNVAAKALREGQFQPKVEDDPKGYKRKKKHKQDPRLDIEDANDPE
ncbi:MAG: hypothetical protein JWQ89_2382 [Devosia sp.]|uniref:DUF7230 family protein n=1 Tax=Devosia sp. TaxID=1871048 RepID=UPI0026280B4F|nr:hypothetical protein [Devosia sp.]MDB5540655.1 hypothetical protein [Devosia sp.]